MKYVTLSGGESVPALGLGTWMLGEQASRRSGEIAALQRGIDLGMCLIDTAEMYGDGASEELVGAAIRGRRDAVFLVSKFYPQHATQRGTQTACEASLRRLGVDCLDLYLLHWRGSVPFAETVAAMESLQAQGKIRHWGVSNLDTDDLRELTDCPGGERAMVDQVLYNLSRRGIEWDLLPWCRARGMAVMAYSPIEQARLLRHPGLCRLADAHGVSPARLALAWLLQQESLIVIPKASTRQHVEENFSALALPFDDALRGELDRLFPPPKRATPLEML